jgi:photosystem II oxygen-evolving enhancer protein 1
MMHKFLIVIAVVVLAVANGFTMEMKKSATPSLSKIATGFMASVFAATSISMPANAISKAEQQSLSYGQVKGSGLANRCPVATGTASISINNKMKVVDLCVEPKSWQVEDTVRVEKGKPVKEFVNTKLMTRQTYSLDGVSGSLQVVDGKAVFTEEDGIDYAATTVQMPGGERVPFLFSLKDLVAKSSSAGPIKPGFDLSGSFTVPSYRTGLFLDPKGRGTTTGYDFAVAIPGLQNSVGEDELQNENNKRFDVLSGDVEFAVNQVNLDEKEFSGVFVSNQPGDTDMGGKVPKRLLIRGEFYGRIEE